MNYDFQMGISVLQMIVFADLLVMVVMHRDKLNSVESFLAFGSLGCYILMDVYWCLSLLLIKEPVYIFSATDVATVGVMLYFASMLRVERRKPARFSIYVFASILFTVGNAVLWAYWSRRYAAMVLLGTAMLICNYGLTGTFQNQLSKRTLRLVMAGALLIVLCEVALVFVTGPLYVLGNVVCYALWIGAILITGAFAVMRKDGALAPAIACHQSALCAQYLSNSFMYIIYVACVTLSVCLIFVQLFRSKGGKAA